MELQHRYQYEIDQVRSGKRKVVSSGFENEFKDLIGNGGLA